MEALLKIFPLDWLNRCISPADPESYRFAKFRGRVKKSHFREKDEYRLSELRFVVLDIETTGFKPQDGDELLSVGAVVVKGVQLREERFHRLVNPHRKIPPLITELTGINDEMVAGADEFCDVMVDFLEFLGDSLIVGYCVDFDLNFLNYKLKPFSFAINNYYLDVITFSKIFNTDLRSHTLDDLLSYMGMEPQGRHTALGDALLTADLFLHFLDRLDQVGIKTMWDLRAFIRHSMLYIS